MKYNSVLIKPASGLCNMNCAYCFYKDEVSKRESQEMKLMSLDTFTNIIKKMIKDTDYSLSIAYQGGEPLIRGLSFFKKTIEIVNQLNTKNIQIHYSLQTNGLLIDADFAEFFKENNFLIGVSLDGTSDVHNLHRKRNNNETFNQVKAAIDLLKKYNVDFNILSVVTKESVKHFNKILNFFKKEGYHYLQFIPCLDKLDEERGSNKYSLDNKLMLEYLKKSFDQYEKDIFTDRRWSHRLFDNFLYMIDGQESEACDMRGICSINYVIEANGDVYPCDFYMLDEHKLGNFNIDSLSNINQKRREIHFVEDSMKIEDDCRQCKYIGLCRGGCRRNRDYYEKGIGKNYYCEAYKKFFDYAYDRLVNIYRGLVNHH